MNDRIYQTTLINITPVTAASPIRRGYVFPDYLVDYQLPIAYHLISYILCYSNIFHCTKP